MNAIELSNVHFAYPSHPDTPVLRGVSFSIQEGELVAIQGASGSGKSTLLHLVGGLIRPQGPGVRVLGQDLATLTADERALFRSKTLGFVFQQFHLLPRADVLQNIVLPLRYPIESQRGFSLERHRSEVHRIAAQLGIEGLMDKLPNQLSGGQQQRVAIARALSTSAPLILADEPTGNLDSVNAQATLEILKALNAQGKTVVIITHDPEVARACSRVIKIKDGRVEGETTPHAASTTAVPKALDGDLAPKVAPKLALEWASLLLKLSKPLAPIAWENLLRHRARSILNMTGITIGIAAVLAMLTLGDFVRAEMLRGYETMGVNRLMLQGYPSWDRGAADKARAAFYGFAWDRDLKNLPRIFPEIVRLSPQMRSWRTTLTFAGRQVSNDVRMMGVNEDFDRIGNRKLQQGKPMSAFHVRARAPTCWLGFEAARQLFRDRRPLGETIQVSNADNRSFACRVMGVYRPMPSPNEWNKPDSQVVIPYTTFETIAPSWWDALIHDVQLTVAPGTNVEHTSKKIQAFFKQKYGASGRFSIDSDAVTVFQMKRSLNLFSVLLVGIALLSLLVGGLGITNMMLVSVTERFKELGLRKALGATDASVRTQLLLEALMLCGAAGALGLVLGFAFYESALFGASKFVSKLPFEWTFNGGAVLLSVASILAVGLLSGLMPALKAEKLEVIESLRAE